MQEQLRLMGEVNGEVANLPWNVVSQCRTIHAAYRLCISQSRTYRTHDNWAALIGLKHRGSFNRILNCDQQPDNREIVKRIGPDFEGEQLNAHRVVRIQKAAGNRAISQWIELYEKGMLDCQKSKRSEEMDIAEQLAIHREALAALEQKLRATA